MTLKDFIFHAHIWPSCLTDGRIAVFFYFLLFLKTAGCWDLFSSHPSVSPFCFLIMPAFAEGENKWLGLDISSAVEFQRYWVLIKSNSFGQESTHLKDFLFKSVNELRFVKKCQNCTFKVNFGCQKLIEFFQKKNII